LREKNPSSKANKVEDKEHGAMSKPLSQPSNVPQVSSFEEIVLRNSEKRRSVVMRLTFCAIVAGMFLHSCWGQDLAPRAYLITPIHSNAVNLTYSFYHGGLDFNGVVPITGATGTYSVPIVSLYHSFSFLGRSANIAAWLPYGIGTFQGAVLGTSRQVYRSGLFDSGFRFSVNLKGGPAMPISQFAKWKQTVVLGASLKVIAPTGQYDSTKLINWGINRWAFKPEFGYSQRFSQKWGLWTGCGPPGETSDSKWNQYRYHQLASAR
jgi:hypothetical protein